MTAKQALKEIERIRRECPHQGVPGNFTVPYYTLDALEAALKEKDRGSIWNRRATSPLDAARLAVVEAAKRHVPSKEMGRLSELAKSVTALERIEKEADGG